MSSPGSKKSGGKTRGRQERAEQPSITSATINSAWFGDRIHASKPTVETCSTSEAGLEVKCLPETSLKRVWHVEPGAADEPGAVYAGGDPGVLFKSEDWGQNWSEVASLTAHPTRDKWTPGAGGMCLHSIQCLGGGRMIAAISAAGAFRTVDGGATWEPFNAGSARRFPAGQVPGGGPVRAQAAGAPGNPEALYQQNHCGIYKAKFGAKKWTDISKGLPSRFGFGLAVPAAEPDTMFTVPIEGAEYRCVPEAKFRVARSRDGGKNWTLLTRGLPQRNAHLLVLRESMAADRRSPAGIYVGTTSGQVFHTADAGNSWKTLAENLPPVISVSVAN